MHRYIRGQILSINGKYFKWVVVKCIALVSLLTLLHFLILKTHHLHSETDASGLEKGTVIKIVNVNGKGGKRSGLSGTSVRNKDDEPNNDSLISRNDIHPEKGVTIEKDRLSKVNVLNGRERVNQDIRSESSVSQRQFVEFDRNRDAVTFVKSAIGSQRCKVPPDLPDYLTKRREKAKSACQRLKANLPLRWRRTDQYPSTSILSKLRWDRKRHLVYCHLPKVASTTWAWHLLRSSGINDSVISAHRNVHILLQETLKPPSLQEFHNWSLKDSLFFLVSRHPFHRLVSAYKNKIVEAEKRRQHYVDLRQMILEKYHKGGAFEVSLATIDMIPTFRDFCEYVIDSTDEWLKDMKNVQPPDPHWMPMTFTCSPCNLRYDVFSKLETMEKDTNFISSQCDMSDILKPDIVFNPSAAKIQNDKTIKKTTNTSLQSLKNDVTGMPKSSKLEDGTVNKFTVLDSNHFEFRNENKIQYKGQENNEYFKYINQLSSEEIERLVNIYRFDFEIFGYSVTDYR